MILIVGKYESLAECIAEKFRTMRYGNDVLVRNATRLLDFVETHHQEIDMLVYADKPQTDGAEVPSRLEYLQTLWSAAAKHKVPIVLLFYKYRTDHSRDTQLDKYDSWTAKQFRKPPFHYIFKLGEVYGLDDRNSAVDMLYRQIDTEGEVQIPRWPDMEGEALERELDYVYAQDVTRVLYWFGIHRPESGVYELGCGFPRTDTAVATTIFRTLKRPARISYVENVTEGTGRIPPLQAMNLQNLRHIGYRKPFYSIETGIKSYIQKRILKK